MTPTLSPSNGAPSAEVADREAFEAWARSRDDCHHGKIVSDHSGLDYPLGRVLWEAWRAALASLRAAAGTEALPAAVAPHVHETWWLIESTYAPRTLYFAGLRRDGKAPVMVDDASKAARFPTQDAALFTVCHALGLGMAGGGFTLEHMGCVVREHIFDYTPTRHAAAELVSASVAEPVPVRMPTDDELTEVLPISPSLALRGMIDTAIRKAFEVNNLGLPK